MCYIIIFNCIYYNNKHISIVGDNDYQAAAAAAGTGVRSRSPEIKPITRTIIYVIEIISQQIYSATLVLKTYHGRTRIVKKKKNRLVYNYWR